MNRHPAVEAAAAKDRMLSVLPSDSSLARKLRKCGSYGYWSGNEWRCGSPACPACRWRYTRKQQREAINRLALADNTDLSLVTIAFGLAGDAESIGDEWRTAKMALRNRFNGQRRRDHRWRSSEITGWLEADPIAYDDMAILGSEQKALIYGLRQPIWRSTGPAWVCHVHGIMHHPDISRAEVDTTLKMQWGGERQVDVQPFYLSAPKEQNIKIVVTYSTKYTTGRWIQNVYDQWNPRWQAEYYQWVNEFSRGWQSMRVRIGPQSQK